jgi:amino acid transporter
MKPRRTFPLAIFGSVLILIGIGMVVYQMAIYPLPIRAQYARTLNLPSTIALQTGIGMIAIGAFVVLVSKVFRRRI